MFVMITEAQLVKMIKVVKAEAKQRKFKQSLEIFITFKDIDVKKGFALNEIIQIPKTSSPATVCVLATGDMSVKASPSEATLAQGV